MADEEDEREPQACGFVLCCCATLRCMRRQWLLISMLTAVGLAVITGFVVRHIFLTKEHPIFTPREIMYTEFIGKLFIRVLQAVTIPLFIFSVMSSLGRLNMKTSGKIGLRAFVFFISTSFCATIFAVILILTIKPGKTSVDQSQFEDEERKPSIVVDNILDFFRNFFPDNVVAACLTGHKTELEAPAEDEHSTAQSPKINANKTIPFDEWKFRIVESKSTNYLGLVTLSVAVGVVMSYMGDDTIQLYHLVDALNEIFIAITVVAIWVSAPCIFCLVLSQVMNVKDWSLAVKQLGLYTLSNLIGLTFIALIFLPTVYSVFLRKWPFKFMYHCIEIAATAFATSSSMATMPMTLTILEEKVHIDQRITRFIVPLGATVNMNGAALYETIAPLFLAQMRSLPLNVGHYLAVCSMAALASVGVAGIPQGGIVTMVMVMNVVNVPAEDISIVIAMDWLLDRFDTMVNVFGDCVASAVVEQLSKKELRKLDEAALSLGV